MKTSYYFDPDSSSVTMSIISHFFVTSFWQSITLSLAIILLSAFIVKKKPSSPDLSHLDGRKIKVLPPDTRYWRFTHGKEMSQLGEDTCHSEPYLIKNKSTLELVIHSPSQVRDFLKDDEKFHVKTIGTSVGRYFQRNLGQCIGATSGKHWHMARFHLEKSFSAMEAASMIEEFQPMLTTWAKSLADSGLIVNQGKRKMFVADSVAICRKLPFHMMSMCLYGSMLTEQRFDALWQLNSLHDRVTHHTFFGTWENSMPGYHFLPTAANRALLKYKKEWADFNLQIVATAKETNTSCRASRLFSLVETGKITFDEYLETLDEGLFTNIDVTAAQFAFGLINMAKYPHTAETFYEEIRNLSESSEEINRYARREDTYLHKMYLEILRHNPPIWFTFAEATAIEKRIDGFLIPAGTAVVLDVRRLNLKSPIWGDTGHEFKPERWDSITTGQARYSWLGYGPGARKCLGKNFANILLKLFLVNAIRHFALSTDTNKGATKISREHFSCVPEQLVVFEEREELE